MWKTLVIAALAMLAGGAIVLALDDPDGMSTDNPAWTLYASKASGERAYVATFDLNQVAGASESSSDACKRASLVFSGRDAGTKYWCEPGRYRPQAATPA